MELKEREGAYFKMDRMPKTCGQCPFIYKTETNGNPVCWCDLIRKISNSIQEVPIKAKSQKCPLISIPMYYIGEAIATGIITVRDEEDER